jgi:hypothetical protein
MRSFTEQEALGRAIAPIIALLERGQKIVSPPSAERLKRFAVKLKANFTPSCTDRVKVSRGLAA